MARECRAPAVETNNRPCFICNKTGHIARNCPLKGQNVPVKSVSSLHFGCIVAEPERSNSFAALFGRDEDFPEAVLDDLAPPQGGPAIAAASVRPGLAGPRPKTKKISQKEASRARILQNQIDELELQKASYFHYH